MAVYEALVNEGGHRSVDELVATLAAGGIRLPRMTVYNVVKDLRDARLVMQADTGPGRTLYEVATTWHHHFVCRRCGRIVDVPCATGEAPCLAPDEAPGSVDEAQVIYRGVCDDCAPHVHSPVREMAHQA